MLFWRHLGLKLRVNAIVKWRSPCSLVCEILTPVILIGLLGYLSTLPSKTLYLDQTYECDTESPTNSECGRMRRPCGTGAENSDLTDGTASTPIPCGGRRLSRWRRLGSIWLWLRTGGYLGAQVYIFADTVAAAGICTIRRADHT